MPQTYTFSACGAQDGKVNPHATADLHPKALATRTPPETKGPTVKDDSVRIESYNAHTVATTVGLKVASMLSTMKTGFADQCASFVAKEIAIQGVLNAVVGGIPTIQYPFYLNFGRELWALSRKGIAGPSALMQGVSLEEKYEDYGLAAVTLKKIALDVFTMIIP